MADDSRLVQLYNEEEGKVINFIEYKRLAVQGQIYALLQPEEDMDLLVPFRVEEAEAPTDEVYIYIVDDEELRAVEHAWQKLYS